MRKRVDNEGQMREPWELKRINEQKTLAKMGAVASDSDATQAEHCRHCIQNKPENVSCICTCCDVCDGEWTQAGKQRLREDYKRGLVTRDVEKIKP